MKLRPGRPVAGVLVVAVRCGDDGDEVVGAAARLEVEHVERARSPTGRRTGMPPPERLPCSRSCTRRPRPGARTLPRCPGRPSSRVAAEGERVVHGAARAVASGRVELRPRPHAAETDVLAQPEARVAVRGSLDLRDRLIRLALGEGASGPGESAHGTRAPTTAAVATYVLSVLDILSPFLATRTPSLEARRPRRPSADRRNVGRSRSLRRCPRPAGRAPRIEPDR